MNLLELYRCKPRNYLIHSSEIRGNQFAGGVGKTTQLLFLVQELAGKSVFGRTVIPIYIKMAELNLKQIGPGVLYEYFLAHFNNCVTQKAIDEMIQKASDYDFLLLLDGLNEVNNYVVNGQTVYTYIKNDLKALGKNENVHMIISARTELDLFEDDAFGERFMVKRLSGLEESQIKEYLEIENLEQIPEPLRKICKNPMLLRMFKVVYEKDEKSALSLASRYDLMKKFFDLDTEFKKNERWSDNLISVRKYVIEEILPLIAFYVEEALLNIRENAMEDLRYEEILEEIFSSCEIPLNMDEKTVKNVIAMTGIVDKNLIFQHDMIRDYLAVQGFKKIRKRIGVGKRIEKFFKLLSLNMNYIDSNGMEYERRTRYLDFAEFLYADGECVLPYTFYYDLAGIHKDLNNRELAVEVGKIALEMTERLEQEEKFTVYEKANFYNYLGYCINADKSALFYLQRAEDTLKKIPEDEMTDDCHKLQGKILSNFGSYYYSKEDYASALEWHKKALEYRLKYGVADDVVHSYRTIMSDYFWMKDYQKAYECYCEGKNVLAEDVVDLELEERVIGSEMKLLQDAECRFKEELAAKMQQQIQIVYDGATKSARKNMDLLKSLYKKLITLEEWFGENREEYSSLQEIVEIYESRCKALIV